MQLDVRLMEQVLTELQIDQQQTGLQHDIHLQGIWLTAAK